MGDTLFGGMESGTPMETRGGTEQLANWFQSQLANNNFQRMGAQSFANLFGITPGQAGTGDVIASLLADPESMTRGLFTSMRPFEQRMTRDAVAGTRNMFGTAGGRFSRNLADAESQVRGELADRFARTRQEGLLSAQAQRGNFLGQLFGLSNQNAANNNQLLGIMSQFLAPGAPVMREGILPGLIGAGGNLLMASMLGPAAPMAAGGLDAIFANGGSLNPGAGMSAPGTPPWLQNVSPTWVPNWGAPSYP